jgi:hypothetical protein
MLSSPKKLGSNTGFIPEQSLSVRRERECFIFALHITFVNKFYVKEIMLLTKSAKNLLADLTERLKLTRTYLSGLFTYRVNF